MLYDPKWNVDGVARTLIEARSKVEQRNCWAANCDELGPDTNCLSTAIGHEYEAHERFARANGLSTFSPYGSVIEFNDSHTHGEVLAALDRAIAFGR